MRVHQENNAAKRETKESNARRSCSEAHGGWSVCAWFVPPPTYRKDRYRATAKEVRDASTRAEQWPHGCADGRTDKLAAATRTQLLLSAFEHAAGRASLLRPEMVTPRFSLVYPFFFVVI